MWLHLGTSEAAIDWLYRDMDEVTTGEVTTDELDEWADIAFADPYDDPPAEKPPPTTRAVFAKMTDAIEAVAHKLTSAEYKQLFDAAHVMFEHCSRQDPGSWFTSHFATFGEPEGFVDRVRGTQTRAGQIPPSPAMVFHGQELPPPTTEWRTWAPSGLPFPYEWVRIS